MRADLGQSPNVLEIPPLSKGMLDINSHILEASASEIADLQISSREIARSYVHEAIISGVFRSAELAQEIAGLVTNFGRPEG